jgi:predicted N-acetyltransferase YhbS
MLPVRSERASDIDAITRVTEEAFRNAAQSDHTEQFIVLALRRAGALSVSLVAEQSDRIVGHVAFSPVQISDGSQNWYGLGPVSVLPEFQNQGIGCALIRQGLTDLRGLGAEGCVVLGEPGYYRRFGFVAVPGLGLPEVPPDYFQALSFGDPPPTGTVAYHAAFAAKT